MTVLNLTDSQFEKDVLKSELPVLIDFWAPWCGPCKMIALILEQTSVELEGKVKIVKVNVDENQEISSKYGIRGIPTLMIFKNGDLEATKVGAVNKGQLIDFINQHI